MYTPTHTHTAHTLTHTHTAYTYTTHSYTESGKYLRKYESCAIVENMKIECLKTWI